jgi:protein O-mannosyl-transferase
MNAAEKRFQVRDLFLSTWHPYAWIALIGFLLYMRVLTFSEYTQYDDHFLIVESYSYIDHLSDIGHAFLEDVGHQGQGGNLYRPMLTISFILSAQLSGTASWGYHLVDILLHGLSCCLLFAALQAVGIKRLSSFIGALVFCVHPVFTQAVAWISGRNDSLLAIFILSCFIMYSKYISTSAIQWYFLHLLFLALALFTKETAIVFPFLALFYYIGVKKEKIISLTTLLLFTGWGIVFANWHLLRTASHVVSVAHPAQAASTVCSNLWITFYYIGKIFWPFDPAFAPVAADMHVTAGIISLGALMVLILLSERKDMRMIVFGIAWFAVFLIPTFYYHTEIHGPAKFYEHRIYVPCIGIWLVLLSLSFTNRVHLVKQVLPWVLVLVLCGFGWLSYSHCAHFENSLALFEYDAATTPNDPRVYKVMTRMEIPQNLRAVINTIQGRPNPNNVDSVTVSKKELWQILDTLGSQQKLENQNPEFSHALAVAYFARGFLLKSEASFLSAIHNNPQDAALRYNLGVLYYDAHSKEKAERAWNDAVRLNPWMGKGHHNLAYYYYESGQYELAWEHCQKAMQLGIEIPEALVNEIQRKTQSQSRQ